MRIAFQILAVIIAGFAGFVVAGMLAGRLLIPPDAGLTGATEAVLYGAAGAIASMLIAGLAVRRSASKGLIAVSTAFLVAIALLVLIASPRSRDLGETPAPSEFQTRAPTISGAGDTQ